jgi:Tfp pilus assembly protein PilF
VGLRGELSQLKQEVVSLYDLALKALRGQRIEEARAALKQALARDPEDGPSKTLLARLDGAGTMTRVEGR